MAMGYKKINSYPNPTQARSPHLDYHLGALPLPRMENNAAARGGSPDRGTSTRQIAFKAEFAPPQLARQQ
jgi:hypothetical protein